ncbi:MAG: allophanate hydrolase subunit 1 [Actinomycetota bacterium]|nr:allophanate hydrolase subunit 1 [Acidimicrobiia bacterium]MDQ3470501.1 allophanate hydrolase subunit 1 [Actinomycetota bacterium]
MARSGRILPFGPQAWLVEHDDPLGFAAAVQATLGDDVDDIVPAATTVLVVAAPAADRTALAARLAEVPPVAVAPERERHMVEIGVVYDGEDLDTVAALTGLAVEAVVARHTRPTYRVGFCGFAPGFAYLTGLDPVLHLSRRETPRTRVPAGAVAIAAGYSAVYPSESPGGWHLLGRTDAPMWRSDRDPPALLVPGSSVRFVEARR